jgi:hypothetical protein
MSTYGVFATSEDENYFDSVYGTCIHNIMFHTVLTSHLAKVGVIGIICTVWYAESRFTNILLASLQFSQHDVILQWCVQRLPCDTESPGS